MSLTQWFKDFCGKLPPDSAKRASIADRTARITRRLNTDFRDTTSDSAHRFYAGSYGRNTAIASISDIDLMYVLPYDVYKKYDAYESNGQSALLQAVRASLNTTYPNSPVVGDGQVVKISFTDEIVYEIVPCFLNKDESYTYPNANNGGTWQVCSPKLEINAFAMRNVDYNYNLVELGRMARAWRDFNNVNISGMLIDTLAYQFIDTWGSRDKSYLYYDWMTRDFFEYLGAQDRTQDHWRAPGSGSWVRRTGSFELRARAAHLLAVDAIENVRQEQFWAAKNKFRQIYGASFPE